MNKLFISSLMLAFCLAGLASGAGCKDYAYSYFEHCNYYNGGDTFNALKNAATGCDQSKLSSWLNGITGSFGGISCKHYYTCRAAGTYSCNLNAGGGGNSSGASCPLSGTKFKLITGLDKINSIITSTNPYLSCFQFNEADRAYSSILGFSIDNSIIPCITIKSCGSSYGNCISRDAWENNKDNYAPSDCGASSGPGDSSAEIQAIEIEMARIQSEIIKLDGNYKGYRSDADTSTNPGILEPTLDLAGYDINKITVLESDISALDRRITRLGSGNLQISQAKMDAIRESFRNSRADLSALKNAFNSLVSGLKTVINKIRSSGSGGSGGGRILQTLKDIVTMEEGYSVHTRKTFGHVGRALKGG